MSGARKLQTEIDRVMKKVDEGVSLFDEIWEKVYSAEQQNQKEKYEMDLKKEIKKLQRLRDQIKTWIGSSEVKDKDALLDARRLIETKMEQFKVCEKETKTKTYSKEGLARAEKLDPAEEAKMKTMNWISQTIDTLNQLIEDRDVEIERLSAGKGKKTNKHVIEEYNGYIANHRYHVNKLEGIMRLVNNDLLEIEQVDELKEDIEYYVEAHEDDEYIQAYDEEMFYESLGLEDLDVVNVDRVTQAQSSSISRTKSVGSSGDVDNDSESKSSNKKEKKSKAQTSNSMPITIGRARSSGEKEKTDKLSVSNNTPVKSKGNSNTNSDTASVSSGKSQSGPTVNSPATSIPTVLGPAPSKVSTISTQGASMAAILKREGEAQQEKERKNALQMQQQQQQQLRDQVRVAQAEQLRQQQQQLQRHQQDQLQRHQEALRQQEVARQQEAALKRQQQQLQEERAAAAAKQQQQLQNNASSQVALSNQHQSTFNQQQNLTNLKKQNVDNLLPSGLGGLSLGNTNADANPTNNTNRTSPDSAVSQPQQQIIQQNNTLSGPNAATLNTTGVINNNSNQQHYDFTSTYLGALNESYLHCPSTLDSERQKTYTPRNPYPTPSCYPSTPSPIFDTHPSIFEKLGTDCLFFIFYYAQGTYQQYLAARELKKQSWRYHKKYMTWFQRHEEPKITTDEYEQGTYVYFDYETGWCQRIKSDFRFEYSYLEDSLII